MPKLRNGIKVGVFVVPKCYIFFFPVPNCFMFEVVKCIDSLPSLSTSAMISFISALVGF